MCAFAILAAIVITGIVSEYCFMAIIAIIAIIAPIVIIVIIVIIELVVTTGSIGSIIAAIVFTARIGHVLFTAVF